MIVVDSSALLAALLGEAGGDKVLTYSPAILISSVNLCESMTRAIDLGHSASSVMRLVRNLEVQTAPFDRGQALAAAELRGSTKHLGLSLGDRACLALGIDTGRPVLTADRAWAKLDLGLEIVLIR